MQEVPTLLVLQLVLVHTTNKLHVYSGTVQLVIFLSLCVMRLQLAFDCDLQLAHGCAPISKNGFVATIFLNA